MKVFISHAMEPDGPLAHRLAEGLQKAGFEIWIAPDSIQPSEEWVDAINRGLRESDVLLLLLTSAAVYSTWVNLEMSAAIMLEREGQLRIVPLQVQACEPPALWRAYQAIPFGNYETCLKDLLQVLTGQVLPSDGSTLRLDPLRAFPLQAGVYCAAFSPDGHTLLAGLRDGTLWRWDLTAGVPLEPLQAHEKTVNCVAFHPTENLLASASVDHFVRLWITPEGTLHQTLEGHTDSVRAVSFSPDGQLLVSGSRDGTLRLWAMPDGTLVRVLHGHEKSVYDVVFAPDGKTIASVSSDNTVRLWSVESGEGEKLGRLESTILSNAFSPGGELLATGTWAGFIRLWDVTEGAKGRLLEGHNDRVHRLVFSPDGELLLSSSKDATIRLWDISEGERAYPPLRLHSGWVRGLALSPDGTLMVSGDTDGLMQLWRVFK
jgi:WD40 repeat protein